MPKTKRSAEPPDPDKLKRESAGSYRTTDERFEVRQAGTGWFLVDSTQQNELGQELMTGPHATLDAVRQAIPPARSSKVRPMKPPKRATPVSAKKAAAAPPPQPPESWLDRLPHGEAKAVRALIRATERAGLPNAEQLVRRDREGLGPALATRLIEHALEEIVDAVPPGERDAARRLARRLAALLSADGVPTRTPLPGWTLVEIGADGEPPNRRITIR